MDVDTGSYTVARRYVHDGNIPDPDSIRVEEFVNFFDQGYARPEQEAFSQSMLRVLPLPSAGRIIG